MKIEKEKRKVAINCEGGLLVKGFIYLNQGERLSDFLNNSRENFIAVTSAEFNSTKEIESLKLFKQSLKSFIGLLKKLNW